jgi:hypothetical protein
MLANDGTKTVAAVEAHELVVTIVIRYAAGTRTNRSLLRVRMKHDLDVRHKLPVHQQRPLHECQIGIVRVVGIVRVAAREKQGCQGDGERDGSPPAAITHRSPLKKV